MTTDNYDLELMNVLDAAAPNRLPGFEEAFARAFVRAESRNQYDKRLALKIQLAAATILTLVGSLGLGVLWRVISLIQVQPVIPFIK
jgi:hypothetical protein